MKRSPASEHGQEKMPGISTTEDIAGIEKCMSSERGLWEMHLPAKYEKAGWCKITVKKRRSEDGQQSPENAAERDDNIL